MAHWRLDEGDGTTTDDASGNNHGTVHGAACATTISVLGSKYADADIRFAGAMDDISVYDFELTPSEVVDLSR